MVDRVLILGGRGRVGSSIAADLLKHTEAEITITGRSVFQESEQHQHSPKRLQPGDPSRGEQSGHTGEKPSVTATASGEARLKFLLLDLADQVGLKQAIAQSDLVIHCAGPFRYRDCSVLQTCIAQGINYIDVSDDRSFTRSALAFNQEAKAVGITAIVNSGVFPGISNSMVRQAVEQFDTAETIHLSYVVAGSGGAGKTVMRTTFLGLQRPFEVWMDQQWRSVRPYTGREAIDFPAPFGRTGVYWFDMPEAFTLVETFPVRSVIVKFGSAPDFYNHLTALVARWFPTPVMQTPQMIESLANVSYGMTSLTDRFSGIGVAMRAEVSGQKNGQMMRYCSTFVHESTAIAVGYGTGSLAELVLSKQLQKPGVWAIEQALSTPQFEQAMQSRGVAIDGRWV